MHIVLNARALMKFGGRHVILGDLNPISSFLGSPSFSFLFFFSSFSRDKLICSLTSHCCRYLKTTFNEGIIWGYSTIKKRVLDWKSGSIRPNYIHTLLLDRWFSQYVFWQICMQTVLFITEKWAFHNAPNLHSQSNFLFIFQKNSL